MLWVIGGIFFFIYLLYELVTESHKKHIDKDGDINLNEEELKRIKRKIKIEEAKRKIKIEEAKRQAEEDLREIYEKEKEIKDLSDKKSTASDSLRKLFEGVGIESDENTSRSNDIVVDSQNYNNEFDKLIESKGIPHLCHFTDIRNLDSIMKYGLISVSDAEEMKIHPIKNDSLRLDANLNGISLSVSFPNSKMFYKYRVLSKSHWAVILLDTSVIKMKKCNFYKMNAADRRMRVINFNDLQGIEAFESMFERNSEDKKLPSKYTTDEQAEVMVFEKIEKKFIKKIIFNNRDVMNDFFNKYKDQIEFEVELQSGSGYSYFSSRDFALNKERNLWH